jgi:hypothetical protein
LDKYPSYTYNLGLYILTPEEYNTLVESPTTSETISFPGDQLLIRSGGGPVGQGKRNPYFSDCDFVLDNLKIDAVIGFSEQGIPSSVGRLSFTVTEPVGATFIYRLQSATADLANRDPNSANQYFNHTYALVIRFYGYDDNGNPITPKGDINQLDQAGSSESAVTTKIFLFMLSDIKTRIGARVVEYQMQGIFSSSMPARTAMLGVSPTHYTVTGANLNDIFNGVPGTTNASSTEDDPRSETTATAAGVNQSAAAPTATAQSSQNVPVKGLCQAINSTLYRLANPQGQEVKSIEIPDEYEVLFASEKLRSAKVLIPDVDNSLQTSAGSATTGPASTKAENTRKNTSVSKYAKNFQIQEGQQIIQWLDMMIRNCDYIKNQAAFTIKESADADIQGDNAWQPLIDAIFGEIVDNGLSNNTISFSPQCAEHEISNSKPCIRDIWYGPLYWIRTHGGKRPLPQPPRAFIQNGTVSRDAVDQALKGFPDDIREFELRRLVETVPVPLGPGGPQQPINTNVPPHVTEGLGQLIMEYTKLVPNSKSLEFNNPNPRGIARREGFQVLVDEAFAFIVKHLEALVSACESDNHQPGLCLKWVWFGLFRWPRTLGGQTSRTELLPSEYSKVGVHAALAGFPRYILTRELEQVEKVEKFIQYLTQLPQMWRRLGGDPPCPPGIEWDPVRYLLLSLNKTTVISPGWANSAIELSNFLETAIPWNQPGILYGCHSPYMHIEQQNLDTFLTKFVTETPEQVHTRGKALETIIRTAINANDRLQLAYARCVLQMISLN